LAPGGGGYVICQFKRTSIGKSVVFVKIVLVPLDIIPVLPVEFGKSIPGSERDVGVLLMID
jgi:hypothetical protein